MQTYSANRYEHKTAIERVQALADILRSVLYAFAVYTAIIYKLTYMYVVITTIAVH